MKRVVFYYKNPKYNITTDLNETLVYTRSFDIKTQEEAETIASYLGKDIYFHGFNCSQATDVKIFDVKDDRILVPVPSAIDGKTLLQVLHSITFILILIVLLKML